MGIYIELYGHILVHLNIELLDAVLAENAEKHLTGILTRNFKNIVLRHPGIACACRDATLCW